MGNRISKRDQLLIELYRRGRENPEQTPEFDLDILVGQITPQNRHEEIETGSAVGREFS